jgi:hypothetical protein
MVFIMHAFGTELSMQHDGTAVSGNGHSIFGIARNQSCPITRFGMMLFQAGDFMLVIVSL